MEIATLLVSCPDRKGIVASLAQLLYGHGANIVHSSQHTDELAGMFFQRIRFDLGTLTSDPDTLEAKLRETAVDFSMTWRIAYAAQRQRVAIFCSKQEHCLYDLLIRHRAGELPCTIAMVVSNHSDLEEVARHFDVPFRHVQITPETKTYQETAMLDLLRSANVELVVLARYMQFLSEQFVAHYPSRIINIHHSFLPAFVGANPYRQAYERGVKLIGATSHYVTADLDQGPIIEQETIRCTHGDSVEDLVRKGREVETRVLAAAVRLHLQDRILVYSNKTVVFH